ncbi:MAG: twin-arginine translocase TatA/TatE family subunit [Croceibacterium sp.]
MGGFSMMHWVIVALVILVLFGRGKISETMGDFGKGIKSFRKGMAEEADRTAAPPAAQIPVQQAEATPAPSETAAKQ